MSSISVIPEWNLPSIANSAGASRFYYSEGLLFAECSQGALDIAVASYDHAAELSKPSKVKGFDYNGVMVPVTNIDSSGAMEIKLGFEEFGMTETNFEMSNGLSLHLTAAEWPEFKAKFFLFRASFFG